MNDSSDRVPGVPTSRRGMTYEGLLGVSRDLLTARFVLARALDRLTTEQLLELLDEVDETLERQRSSSVRLLRPTELGPRSTRPE